MPTRFTMNTDINDLISGQVVGANDVELHFDLNVTGLLKVADTARPSLLNFKRVTGYVRSDGRMYNSPGKRAAPYDIADAGDVGVRLMANDIDVFATPPTYTVTATRLFNGKRTQFMTFVTVGDIPTTDVPANLADYAPNPTIAGGGSHPGGDGTDPIDGGAP